jgi:hypothetical protein
MSGPWLTDERLCWLAVRDELNRKARGGSAMFLRIFGASRGRRAMAAARDATGDIVSNRLRHYAVAVDELAEQLSPEERQTLRMTGQVPAWFLGRVEDRAAQLRKAR